MLGPCYIPESPRNEAPGAYLLGHDQGLNLLVPRTADQSFRLSCARIVEVTFAPWATRCKCKNRNV